MSILKDLYNGKLYPLDNLPIDMKEQRELSKRAESAAQDYLKKHRLKWDKDFDDVIELNTLASSPTEDAAFQAGFQLGMQITLDALGWKEPPSSGRPSVLFDFGAHGGGDDDAKEDAAAEDDAKISGREAKDEDTEV